MWNLSCKSSNCLRQNELRREMSGRHLVKQGRVWQSPNFVFSLVPFHDFVAFYFLKLRCCCMFWPIDGDVIPEIMQFSWRLGREKANLDGVVERERKEAVVACEVSCNTCEVWINEDNLSQHTVESFTFFKCATLAWRLKPMGLACSRHASKESQTYRFSM